MSLRAALLNALERGARSSARSAQGDLFPETAPNALRVYHGTPETFAPDKIAPWSHFGTEAATRQRLNDVKTDGWRRVGSGSNVLPYEITGRRVSIGDEPAGQWRNSSEVADGLLRNGHITREEHAWAIEPVEGGRLRFLGRDADEVVQDRISELAARHDIGAIGYRNIVEDPGSMSYIVPNPRNNTRPRGLTDGNASLKALAIGIPAGGLTLRELLREQYGL